MAARYTVTTQLDKFNNTIYWAYDSKPDPFDPARRGPFATQEDAEAEIVKQQKRAAWDVACAKAEKLTKGARKQLEHHEWLAHYQSLRDDTYAELLATI